MFVASSTAHALAHTRLTQKVRLSRIHARAHRSGSPLVCVAPAWAHETSGAALSALPRESERISDQLGMHVGVLLPLH